MILINEDNNNNADDGNDNDNDKIMTMMININSKYYDNLNGHNGFLLYNLSTPINI